MSELLPRRATPPDGQAQPRNERREAGEPKNRQGAGGLGQIFGAAPEVAAAAGPGPLLPSNCFGVDDAGASAPAAGALAAARSGTSTCTGTALGKGRRALPSRS